MSDDKKALSDTIATLETCLQDLQADTQTLQRIADTIFKPKNKIPSFFRFLPTAPSFLKERRETKNILTETKSTSGILKEHD